MQRTRNFSRSSIATAIFLGLVALPTAALAAGDAVMVNPEGIKWGPSPPFLPKGARFAVLYGAVKYLSID